MFIQIVPTLDPIDGGPAHNASGVANALLASGEEVAQFVYSGSRTDAIGSPFGAGLFFRADMGTVVWVIGLVRAIRSSRLVACHGWYTPSTILGSMIAVVLRRPFVIVPHGVFTDYQRRFSVRRKRIFDATFGIFARKALGLCVATEHEGERAQVATGMQTFVTGIGIDVPQPMTSWSSNWDGGEVRLLSLSRIAQKKRLDLTIEALAVLQERNVRCHLDIAGTGDTSLRQKLLDQIEVLGIADHVSWHGAVHGEDKVRLFTDSHVFVLPTDDENFGISIVEALSYGRPVVTTVNADASVYVRMSGAGSVLDQATSNSIADAVMELCSSKSHWIQVSSRARETVAEHLSWTAVSDRWIHLMDTI